MAAQSRATKAEFLVETADGAGADFDAETAFFPRSGDDVSDFLIAVVFAKAKNAVLLAQGERGEYTEFPVKFHGILSFIVALART